MAGYTYKGNDDFRGYLAVADPYALKYTGNNGLIDRGKVNSQGADTKVLSWDKGQADNVQNYVTGLYDKWVGMKQSKETDTNNAYLNGLNQQLAALQAQLAYTPKLPTYDIMGNYKRARSTAESKVNPLYAKYLKDFLAGQKVKKTNKQTETGLTKAATALDLSQTIGQNAVDRTRTGEDTTSAIQKITEQEGQMQQDTGTQFDVDRRALAEKNAASGVTTSGIGGGNMFVQQDQRNISEARQVQEASNQRDAKRLFASRTFEDLARGDTNATAIASSKDKQAQFDLDAYLSELAIDETQYRADNEVKRLTDINNQSQTYERQGTQSFLSSLAGAGWRPQDIALAYQVYG
jgi:hypothetical protein